MQSLTPNVPMPHLHSQVTRCNETDYTFLIPVLCIFLNLPHEFTLHTTQTLYYSPQYYFLLCIFQYIQQLLWMLMFCWRSWDELCTGSMVSYWQTQSMHWKQRRILHRISKEQSYQRQVKIIVYTSLKQDILNIEKNLRKKATLTHNIFYQLYL